MKFVGINKKKMHDFFGKSPTFVAGKKTVKTVIFSDDASKTRSTSAPIVKRFISKLGETPLIENIRGFNYTVHDGKRFQEAIQVEREVGDEKVVFTAIKSEDGNWVDETLWSEEEINEKVTVQG
jgi:hypothetical protein